MKQAYYFSHDSNARNDVKIVKLRRMLTLEAYGAYWCLIEMLRESSTYSLPISSLEDIAFSLHVPYTFLHAIVHDFDLFEIEGDQFSSLRLKRNMDAVDSNRSVKSESGKKGMESRWNNKKKMIL